MAKKNTDTEETTQVEPQEGRDELIEELGVEQDSDEPEPSEPEPEPEPDESPPSESEAEPKPEGDLLTSEPPSPEAYRKMLEQERAAFEQERAGFLRTITDLRSERRQQQQPEPQPQTVALPEKLPVEFDEKGEAYVPAAAATELFARMQQQNAPQPPDPVQQVMQLRESQRQRFILENPSENATPVNEFYRMYDEIDALTEQARARHGNPSFTTIAQALDFIERTGVAKSMMEKYPERFRSIDDVDQLVEAGITFDERRIRRVVDRLRPAPGAATATPTATPQDRSGRTNSGSAPVRPVSPEKPRSQAERGRGTDTTPTQTRLQELDAMDPFEMTDEQTEEYRQLIKKENERAARQAAKE